jgi:hypothetical protein
MAGWDVQESVALAGGAVLVDHGCVCEVVCVRSVEDVRRGGGEEQGEEEDGMGVEKVCACLSCTKMMEAEPANCTSHQPTLAFSPKLNAEHRAAPKKILAGQSRPRLPSHAITSPVPGTTRALRVNRRSASCCWKVSRVFPLVAMRRPFLSLLSLCLRLCLAPALNPLGVCIK